MLNTALFSRFCVLQVVANHRPACESLAHMNRCIPFVCLRFRRNPQSAPKPNDDDLQEGAHQEKENVKNHLLVLVQLAELLVGLQ